MLVSEAFERYREDVIVFSNQSSSTEEQHNTCGKHLVSFTGDIQLENLSFQIVRLWKKELERNRSDLTVRGYIIKLRVVLAHGQKLGLDCLDPNLIQLPKRVDHIPTFIDNKDVTCLIHASFRLRSKAIISLLYASGIRLSELLALDRTQLHDNSFSILGKGNKARLCFFDERTKFLIDEYLQTRTDHHPALFLSTQREGRMTATNVQFILKVACKNAGITTRVTPHTLRHSFATNLMRNGMHIYEVSRLMGHASIQTTQIYLHITDINLQMDYEKYHTT